MAYFYDLRIGEIRVVETKKEDKKFEYFNPSRFGDGFVFFCSGKGHVSWSDGTLFSIKPGTLITFKKGDSYRLEVEAPCCYTVTDYDLFSNTELAKIHDCNESEMRVLEEIRDTSEKREATCFVKLRSLILSLYSNLLEKTEKKQSDYISRALSYVFKNYDQNFSVAEIAKECGISPSHLRAIFRKETGTSVFAYREKLRIERAKKLLRSDVFPIKEIADSLGYFDVYHFSKKFKSATSLTPNEYRKSNK